MVYEIELSCMTLEVGRSILLDVLSQGARSFKECSNMSLVMKATQVVADRTSDQIHSYIRSPKQDINLESGHVERILLYGAGLVSNMTSAQSTAAGNNIMPLAMSEGHCPNRNPTIWDDVFKWEGGPPSGLEF
jgi:hypothetical protein